MPDRYGDNDPSPGYPQAVPAFDDTSPAHRQRAQDAIDECHLCDPNGYRGGSVCDHIDHTEAAKRGMAMVRKAMGWTS